MDKKRWIVWLGEQVIRIVYAPVAWTLKQVKDYLVTKCGFHVDIELKQPC